MSELFRNQYVPGNVSPPGETLQEILDERGMSQADLADRSGRPKKTINEIIQGKASITPETALQFERVLGVSAEFWNSREQHYREALARQRDLESFEREKNWSDAFPYAVMVKHGWIPERTSRAERVQELLSFFGVASPQAWRDVWTAQATYRQSRAFHKSEGAIAAWLRKGELEGQRIPCANFDAVVLKEVLKDVRSLTREISRHFARELTGRLSEAGVAIVFVPELPETRAWGATRWLSPTKALIQLSLRYKTDDHFWFTLFHEAGHVLLHKKREIFVETEMASSEDREEEANAFARDWLIPPRQYTAFLRRPARSCTSIRRFAHELGIAPGIVVGRLQHDSIIDPDECNDLKRKVDWSNV